MRNATLYNRWRNMRQRCNSKSNKDYHNYGSRGIKVCEEWDDFFAFQDWALLNGYSKDLTLDRKDNNLGYSPENCRWATIKEQSNNTRKCVWVTFNGVTDTLTGWSKRVGIKQPLLHMRYSKGWRGEKLFKPTIHQTRRM